MVDMGEIIQGLWAAFGPFVGKAMITIAIVSTIGLAIDFIPAYLKKHRNKDE